MQHRLQRLRAEKVIRAEVAIVDPKAVGQGMAMLVELGLERDQPESLPALHAWIARTDQIQEAWYVSGRGDATLVVTATDIEAFDTVMVGLMEANRTVRKFTTSGVLRALKRERVVAVEVGDRWRLFFAGAPPWSDVVRWGHATQPTSYTWLGRQTASA